MTERKDIIIKRRCKDTGTWQFVVDSGEGFIAFAEFRRIAKRYTAKQALTILDKYEKENLKIEQIETEA